MIKEIKDWIKKHPRKFNALLLLSLILFFAIVICLYRNTNYNFYKITKGEREGSYEKKDTNETVKENGKESYKQKDTKNLMIGNLILGRLKTYQLSF